MLFSQPAHLILKDLEDGIVCELGVVSQHGASLLAIAGSVADELYS
jgi:hypothetical protein